MEGVQVLGDEGGSFHGDSSGNCQQGPERGSVDSAALLGEVDNESCSVDYNCVHHHKDAAAVVGIDSSVPVIGYGVD